MLCPLGIDVHEGDAHGREPVQQSCNAAAEHPGADDRNPVADERGGVPQRVDRRLDGAGEDGTGGWDALRHDRYGTGRHHVGGLVRVEAEHRAAAQVGRPFLHGADVQVAVLDRPREVPFLERRPHPRVLVRRHSAAEYERLGAAADPRPYGAYDNVGRPRFGEPDRTDLSTTRRSQPERMRDPVIDFLVSGQCCHTSLTG